MLIKLRAPAGPARTEVLQLAEIFRARVVDVSERGITLCVSGDPGKVCDVCDLDSSGKWALLHGLPPPP
jgi:acetolactate synthase I/III small subunit